MCGKDSGNICQDVLKCKKDVCRKEVGLGAMCGEETLNICGEGFKCKQDVCRKEVGLGAMCGNETLSFCGKGFKCARTLGSSSEICVEIVKNNKGGPCGGNIITTYNACQPGLKCTNSTLAEFPDINEVMNGLCYAVVRPGQATGSECGGQTLNICKPEITTDSATCFKGQCVLVLKLGDVCIGSNSRSPFDPVCNEFLQCAVQTTLDGKETGVCS
jgi:hypothetical protein